MKEHVEPQTDPILEECYRMKAEFAAQFNSIEELYDYLKAREKKRKAQGKIYIDPPHLPWSRASSLLCLRSDVFYRIGELARGLLQTQIFLHRNSLSSQ